MYTTFPVLITGDVLIGEWAKDNGNELSGRIDEVSIFQGKLSDKDISDLYTNGIPAELNNTQAEVLLNFDSTRYIQDL